MSKLGFFFETPNSYTHRYFSKLLNLLMGKDTHGHGYLQIRIRAHKATDS